jgi:hypothetical protein
MKEWNKDIMAGVGLPGKIDDIPELKEALIDVFLTKNHKDISRYSLLPAEHILNLVNIQPDDVIKEVFEINIKWQEGKAKFQEARNNYRPERTGKSKSFKNHGANTPHVHRHALIASDYAAALINLIVSQEFRRGEKKREIQIELMKNREAVSEYEHVL